MEWAKRQSTEANGRFPRGINKGWFFLHGHQRNLSFEFNARARNTSPCSTLRFLLLYSMLHLSIPSSARDDADCTEALKTHHPLPPPDKKHKTCTIILFHMSCHTDIIMMEKEMDGAVVGWMDGWMDCWTWKQQEDNEIKRTAFQFIHRTWNSSKIREKSTRALVRCSLYSFPHLPPNYSSGTFLWVVTSVYPHFHLRPSCTVQSLCTL